MEAEIQTLTGQYALCIMHKACQTGLPTLEARLRHQTCSAACILFLTLVFTGGSAVDTLQHMIMPSRDLQHSQSTLTRRNVQYLDLALGRQ